MRRQGLQTGRWRRWLSPASLAVVGALAVSALSATSAVGSTSHGLKSPITIGVGVTVVPGIYDSKSMYDPALKAAEGYINAHGGWGGRALKIDECVSPGDPASDTACYRQFLADKVTAVMGILANSASVGYPLLSKQHIPSFMLGTTSGDDASPWQHGIGGSLNGAFVSFAWYACAHGYKRVSMMHDDTPSADASVATLVAPFLKRCGISLNNVPVPYGTPDDAPYIQKAIATHPQLLGPGSTGPSITTIVDSVKAAGFPVSRAIGTFSPTPQFLADPNSSGILLQGGWDVAIPQDKNPQVQTYLKEMKKYAPGSDPGAQLSLPAFQELTTIWGAASQIGFGKLTPASLQTYMVKRAPGRLQIFASRVAERTPGLPGVENPYEHLYQWKNGKLIDLGWYPTSGSCSTPKACKKAVAPGSST